MTNTDFAPRRGRPSNAELAARAADGTGSARESRADTVRRERRFRGDTSETADLKLSVPTHLKKPGHTYRWVNDTLGGRIAAMHAKDWDVVSSDAIPGQGEGSPVARNVEGSTPLRAVLMEKPEDWYLEDRARKEAPRKEMEATMMRGALPSKDGLQPNESYVPAGHVNRIERGA